MFFIFVLNQLEKANQRIEELDKEQEALIQILVAEKTEREQEEERLRKSLTVSN